MFIIPIQQFRHTGHVHYNFVYHMPCSGCTGLVESRKLEKDRKRLLTALKKGLILYPSSPTSGSGWWIYYNRKRVYG